MLWFQVKEYIRHNNPDQNIETVKNTAKNYFASYPEPAWLDLVNRTNK